jgi:hypothetical protein
MPSRPRPRDANDEARGQAKPEPPSPSPSPSPQARARARLEPANPSPSLADAECGLGSGWRKRVHSEKHRVSASQRRGGIPARCIGRDLRRVSPGLSPAEKLTDPMIILKKAGSFTPSL